MIISTMNKIERKMVYLCECCLEPIRDGDGYYFVGGNCYCDNCIERNRFIAESEFEEEEND